MWSSSARTYGVSIRVTGSTMRCTFVSSSSLSYHPPPNLSHPSPLPLPSLSSYTWDQVINFYINLLMERNKESARVKTYIFNTHFYSLLYYTARKYDYARVRRWTSKVREGREGRVVRGERRSIEGEGEY